MRLAYKYVPVETAAGRTGRDRTPGEFAATINRIRVGTRDEFLERAGAGYGPELLSAVRSLVDRSQRILSVAAGSGVYEVPLVLEGYDVVASDFALAALEETSALFPELRVRRLDVLRPPETAERWDAILAIDVVYAFDEQQLDAFFASLHGLLRPGGRALVGHALLDTASAWVIDRALLPLWARPRLAGRRPGESGWVRKEHGYRYSNRELAAAARRAGFDAGARVPFAHGLELTRVGLDLQAPRLYRALARLSRRLGVMAYGTLAEFTRR